MAGAGLQQARSSLTGQLSCTSEAHCIGKPYLSIGPTIATNEAVVLAVTYVCEAVAREPGTDTLRHSPGLWWTEQDGDRPLIDAMQEML
jgi:hypothetical protein